MIYVYHRKPNGADPRHEYALSIRDGALQFHYKDIEADKEYDIALNLDQYQGKIIDIVLADRFIKGEIAIGEPYAVITRDSDIYNWVSSNVNLARIAFDEKDIHAVLQQRCADVLNVINGEKPEGKNTASVLLQCSPLMQEIAQKIRNRRTVVNHVDIYASVSYLEAQVDTLTRAMLKLYQENDKLRKILAAADKESVLDIKGEDSIIEEFEEDKHNVRNQQQQYYEIKGARS